MRKHSRDDNRKAQLRGRRGFLKLLTGLGVPATAARTLTQDGLAEMDVDLDREVPYVDRYHHSPEAVQTDGSVEREAIHEAVSRNHWEEARQRPRPLDGLTTASRGKSMDTTGRSNR